MKTETEQDGCCTSVLKNTGHETPDPKITQLPFNAPSTEMYGIYKDDGCMPTATSAYT